MPTPLISSDPHTWLHSVYAQLRKDASFGRLTASLQWNALVRAAAEYSPEKAAQMLHYTDAAQLGLLKRLDDVLREDPHPQRATMLWTMRQGPRDVTCVFVYVPTGVELRLYEGVELIRATLRNTGPDVQSLAESWRSALLENGWTDIAAAAADIHSNASNQSGR